VFFDADGVGTNYRLVPLLKFAMLLALARRPVLQKRPFSRSKFRARKRRAQHPAELFLRPLYQWRPKG
jgi:hypothetical protein